MTLNSPVKIFSIGAEKYGMEVDLPFVCAPSTENSTNAAANTATAALAQLVPIVVVVDVGTSTSTHLSAKFEVSLKKDHSLTVCFALSSLFLLFGRVPWGHPRSQFKAWTLK